MMTKCVVYTRVSSEEQAKVGYSIPFQRAKLEQYAAANRLEAAGWFEDVQTARRSGRPGFRDMLRFLEEHPDVETILVHRLDRLARNFSDYAIVTEQLGVRVRSVVEPVEDNAAGVMQHGVQMAFAKYYSVNLAAEVSKGLRARFEAGGCVSKAPAGYRNISRTRTEKAKVVVDPDIAPAMRRAFERYAGGRASLRDIGDDLFDAGVRNRTGRPLASGQVWNLLCNPFFTGKVRYRAEVRPGLHPAIVPEPLWHRVQKMLKHRSQDHGEKGSKFFLLRGVLYCGRCHGRMTAEDHPKGSYYRCGSGAYRRDCAAPYSPLRKIEAAVTALLPKVSLDEAERRKILVALHRMEAERAASRAREESALAKKAERLDAKLLVLAENLVSGDIPREKYRRIREALEAELAGVEERRAVLSRNLAEAVASLTGFLDTAVRLPDLYQLCPTPDDRKSLLAKVFRRIEVVGADILSIEYHPPFHLLLGKTAAEAGSKIARERALLDGAAGSWRAVVTGPINSAPDAWRETIAPRP